MLSKRFATLALLSCTAFTANAWSASAITGSFISGDMGATQLSTPSNGFPGGTDTKVNRVNLTWGVSLGYNYAPSASHFFGVEMGFNHFGRFKYNGTVAGTTYNTNIRQYDFDFLFDIGVVSQFGLNATLKLGASRVTQQSSGGSALTPNIYKRTDNTLTHYRPKAEIQVGFMPNSSLNIALNFSHLFGRSSGSYPILNNKTISNNSLTLNVQYTIPQ